MVRRCLKICCSIAAVIIILLVVTLVILYFTVFKIKQPQVVATPVNLKHFEFGFPSITLNVTLGLDIFIKNRNHAGFKYDNTTNSIYYHGILVGLAPIQAGVIEARSTEKISTSVDILVDKMIANPYFLPDLIAGELKFTASSTMDGKVILLRIFKFHATTYTSCDITVFVRTKNSSSSCNSRIKG